MTLRRALPVVLVLAVVPLWPAAAQYDSVPPWMPMPSSPWARPPQRLPPACQALLANRDEVAKHGKALEAAGKSKAGPEEMCEAFKPFLAAEAELINGLDELRATCGVPAEVIKQAKDGHARYVEISKKICAVAARGPRHGMPWDVPLPAPRPTGDFWTPDELQRLFGR